MARTRGQKLPNKAELLLGRRIEELRLSREMTRLQLGRKINKTEQQIEKYERGEFIPLPILERLAETLGVPIQKRLIRKISSLRKLEIDTKTEQEGLSELYREALSED